LTACQRHVKGVGLASPGNSDTTRPHHMRARAGWLGADQAAGRHGADTKIHTSQDIHEPGLRGRRRMERKSVWYAPGPGSRSPTRIRAGGATRYTLRRCRWTTGTDAAAAPVEDRGWRTSRQPAAGVMSRRRSGQSSDSGSRSLRTAGLAQLEAAGPRRSTLLLEWGEGRRTVTAGLGRRRWRPGRAGSGGPLTKMCRWSSFSPKCRYRTGYD
jgi:hypothetical protein